jgi:hypothetical protein
MKPIKLFVLILALILLGVIVWTFTGDRTNILPILINKPVENGNGIEEPTDPVELNTMVRLTTPREGSTVSTPLIVRGEARGNWFFEASFPIKLVSPTGRVIAQGFVQAQSDWMTTEFVPFEGVLEFSASERGEARLVLEKDNPSGLPQNDDSVSIRVVLGQTNTAVVKAFFPNSNDSGIDCTVVAPVNRTIPRTTAVARAALEELLKGPTASERQAGFVTSIPTGVKIQKLEIRNGVAYVDFNSALEFNIGGSCLVTSIRSQIAETLEQFSTVSSVVISIDGRTEDILQP